MNRREFVKYTTAATLGSLVLGKANIVNALNGFNTLASPALSLQVQRRWHVLRVDGKEIVDENGLQVLLRGFSIWDVQYSDEWQASQFPLNVEKFQQIRSWGFNVIRIPIWWSFVEPYYSQPGAYDETALKKIENVVKNAEQAGVYVLLGLRVQHNAPKSSWEAFKDNPNMPTADWLLTSEGLQKYSSMLEMIVGRFDQYPNVVGYNPWHFPWHGFWNVPESTRQSYYGTITPAMVNAIRTHSDKIIFYSPMNHGIRALTAVFDTGEFSTLVPVSDPLNNVVYMHDGHRPTPPEWGKPSNEFPNDYPDWSGDTDYLRRNLGYAKTFSDTYNVPVCLAEFGMFIRGSAYNNERPIRQSRLDCLDAKLSILDEWGNYNWLYWVYSNHKVSEGILEADLSPSAVLGVLQKHAPLEQ